MTTKEKAVAKAPEKHGYEFFGPYVSLLNCLIDPSNNLSDQAHLL